MGIPIPYLLNIALIAAILVTIYLIYRDHLQRFLCYFWNVVAFIGCFLFYHAILHSQGFYANIFCGTFPFVLLSVHLLFNYYSALRNGGEEWCKLIYNIMFMFVGFIVAFCEYRSEVTYCHCLYLDLLAAALGMTLKEYKIIEGLPEVIACLLPYITEVLLILGSGKGVMTFIIKYITELTDACPPSTIDYMNRQDY